MRKPDPVSKAWEEFYKANKTDDAKKLRAQGWKTIKEIAAETKATVSSVNSRVTSLVNAKKLEKRNARLMTDRGVRDVAIYRPKSP
jgi:predicted transcriptional regulator